MNKINISADICKVDKENRLVYGFATLDNVDKQGDIIPADVAKAAFSAFRGNLRSMHQPIAVGKVIDFKEDTMFDPVTQKTYNGIYVTAYVSKGSPNEWEKVLDGTYTGFSIGGRSVEKNTEFRSGKSVRVIKDLELFELSLVDSPANQLANILAIQKFDGETTATGISSEISLEDVFYCSDCENVCTGKDSSNCTGCNSPMTIIGWVESSEEEDSLSKVDSILKSYLDSSVQNATDKADNSLQKNKGGDSIMPEDIIDEIEKSDDAPDTTIIEDVVEKSADELIEVEDVVEKSDIVDSVEEIEKSDELVVEEDVLEKSEESVEVDEEVVEKSESTEIVVEDSLEKSDKVVEEELSSDIIKSVLSSIEDLKEKFDAVVKSLAVNISIQSDESAPEICVVECSEPTEEVSLADTVPMEDHMTLKADDFDMKEFISKALSEFAQEQSEAITKAIADVKEQLTASIVDVSKSLEGRVEDLEGGTAIKKSGELGGSSEHIKKGVWNGTFTPQRFFDSNSIID